MPGIAAAAFLAFTSCAEEPAGPVDFDVEPGAHTMIVGESVQLSALGAPGEVQWSSSNSSVATVVPTTGLVTGMSEGEAIITAISGPSYASTTITVNPDPAQEHPFGEIAPIFSTPYAGFNFTPCTNCHTALAGTNAERYNWLIPHVEPGEPNTGRLICKITAGAGCGNPMPLPAAQIQAIREWIAAGAHQ
jgi:Bacterial Ig-like domain (group 2)